MKLKLRVSAPKPTEVKRNLKISKPVVKVLNFNQVVDKWNIDPALIKETCQSLLTKLEQDPEAAPFMELVSKSEYPDYYEFIESPISIKEIRTKVQGSRYAEMDEFRQDILLMFNNCKLYNQPGSAIYQVADRLSTDFSKNYNQMKQGGTKRKLGGSTLSSLKIVPQELKIIDFIEKGDLAGFKKALETTMDVNILFKTFMFNSEFTWALIHACSYYGRLEMVQLLMEKGADPEIQDTWYGGRPLAWACFGGHYKVCKALIEDYDVDKDARNFHDQNAFDLVSDKTPQFRKLFDDSPPEVLPSRRTPGTKTPATKPSGIKTPAHTPVTIKIPPNSVAALVKAATPTHFQTPSRPATLSLQHQQYLQQQQLLAAVKSARRVDTRRQVYTPNIPQQKYQMPQYTNFLSQFKPFEPAALVDEITIRSNDGAFDKTLQINQLGHVICLPKQITSISISLESIDKCTASGYFSTYVQNIQNRNENVLKVEPLNFQKLECMRFLEGYTCYFEIVVVHRNEKQQIFLAFIRQ